MIEKKDWESALAQFEAVKVNELVAGELAVHILEDKIKSYDKSIEFCKKKIAAFAEDDPMPKDVKEIVKGVSDA